MQASLCPNDGFCPLVSTPTLSLFAALFGAGPEAGQIMKVCAQLSPRSVREPSQLHSNPMSQYMPRLGSLAPVRCSTDTAHLTSCRIQLFCVRLWVSRRSSGRSSRGCCSGEAQAMACPSCPIQQCDEDIALCTPQLAAHQEGPWLPRHGSRGPCRLGNIFTLPCQMAAATSCLQINPLSSKESSNAWNSQPRIEQARSVPQGAAPGLSHPNV